MLHRFTAAPLVTFLVVAATSSQAQTNLELRNELLALFESDQSGRALIGEAIQQHGSDSTEVRALADELVQSDATNLARLEAIISEHGWPGASMVGRDGVRAAFFILQHADHETQVQYLPLVRAAVEAGELEPRSFALLQDRILVGEGKPQVFGTQLYTSDVTGKLELYPIEDEANVDSRRLEVGLEPLSDYVKRIRERYGE